MPVARQQIPNKHQWANWEVVFYKRTVRQLRNTTVEELLEKVFYVQFVPRCF
jgi:hypothetical protein